MSGFPESGPGVAIYEHRRPNETSLQYQNQSHEIEAIRARKWTRRVRLRLQSFLWHWSDDRWWYFYPSLPTSRQRPWKTRATTQTFASFDHLVGARAARAEFRSWARSQSSGWSPARICRRLHRQIGWLAMRPPRRRVQPSNSRRSIDGTRPLRQNQNASLRHGRERLLLQLGSIEEVEELLRSRRAAADIL